MSRASVVASIGIVGLCLAGTAACTDSSGGGPIFGGSGSGSAGGGGGGGVPGGTSDTSLLAQHNYMNGTKVRLPDTTVPKDDVQHAICEYVVGTADQVGKAAKLSGTVALDPDSGFKNLGGNGMPLTCQYSSDGKTVFQVLFSDNPDLDPSGASHVVDVKLTGDWTGLIGYAPDYQGDALDESLGRQWLTAAGGRLDIS